jgi:hypothetical protein
MLTRFSSQRVCALAVLASLAGAVNAQSFFEGFEPGPLTPGVAAVPANWTSVNNSVGGPGINPNWQVRNDGIVFPAFAGTTYAFANFNSSTGANDISNYLISPLVTFNNGDTISFYTSGPAVSNYPDRMELVLNTTGSTLPADFTTVLLTVNPTLALGGYPTTWTQFTATVSGLSGPTAGRFAFHYNPTAGGPAGLNSDYIGIDDVSYTAVGGGSLATNTTLGTGCGPSPFNSFYQLFADAAAASTALQGNALQLVATPNGYLGNWIPGGGVPLFVAPVAPTTLTVGDDGDVLVTPTSPLSTPYGPQAVLRVTGNGIIGFGALAQNFPGTNSYTPTANGFLNSTNGGIYAWHDYNSSEAGSGPVLSEEIGGVLYITFNGVENYSTPLAVNTSTLQFQLDLASGNVIIAWTTVDANTTSTFGSGHLVGVTAPGASADSTSIDLSTAALLTVNPEGPMSLAALNTPVQGVGPQSWNLNATNLPVGIGVDIIGLVDPGILDLSLFGLGQPGCQLRATLDVTGAFLAGGSHPWSVPLPGGAPSLSGVLLFVQSAVLPFTVNLANTLTTNGVRGSIGTF